MKFALALAFCFFAARPLVLPRATSTLGPVPIAFGLLRRVYPYSVIPGGIVDGADFEAHRYLATAHYKDVGTVTLTTAPGEYYTSYRHQGKIFWTSKRVKVFEGEVVFTDGSHLVRGRCGNRLSVVPMLPTVQNEPTIEEATEIGVAAPALDAFTFESSSIEGVSAVTPPAVFPPSTIPGTGAPLIIVGAIGATRGGAGVRGGTNRNAGGIVVGTSGTLLAPANSSGPLINATSLPTSSVPPGLPAPLTGVITPLPVPSPVSMTPLPVPPLSSQAPGTSTLAGGSGLPGTSTTPVERSMPLPLPPYEVLFPPIAGTPEASASPLPPIEFPTLGVSIEQTPLPSVPEPGTYLLMGSGLFLVARAVRRRIRTKNRAA